MNHKPLTSRELEILKLIITDKNNLEIAQLLNLSTNTIVTHRKNIMRKLHVKSGIGILRWALSQGIDVQL